MALRYYAEENARHADVHAVEWTFQQCVDATQALIQHFGLKALPVRFVAERKLSPKETIAYDAWIVDKNRPMGWDESRLVRKAWKKLHGKVRSFYSSNASDRGITYHERMLNPLTVAHEVAHYMDHMDHMDRLAKGISNTAEKWHGPRHYIRTNQAVDFVKALPYYVGAQVAAKEARLDIIRTQVAIHNAAKENVGIDHKQVAFDGLAPTHECRKCHIVKTKAEFGMRRMGLDKAGNPIYKKQSYCHTCR